MGPFKQLALREGVFLLLALVLVGMYQSMFQ